MKKPPSECDMKTFGACENSNFRPAIYIYQEIVSGHRLQSNRKGDNTCTVRVIST